MAKLCGGDNVSVILMPLKMLSLCKQTCLDVLAPNDLVGRTTTQSVSRRRFVGFLVDEMALERVPLKSFVFSCQYLSTDALFLPMY